MKWINRLEAFGPQIPSNSRHDTKNIEFSLFRGKYRDKTLRNCLGISLDFKYKTLKDGVSELTPVNFIAISFKFVEWSSTPLRESDLRDATLNFNQVDTSTLILISLVAWISWHWPSQAALVISR